MSNKAIFLDRDGTLIEDPGYLNHPEQVKLLEGVAEALIELRAMGYMLIVVTNQSAVARGIVSEKVLGEIHNRLRQLLTERGAYLDQIYYCPYHPDGVVPKYRKESDWRKPNPGMLLAASDEMDIDLSQSWKIGDSSSDIEAGLRAGCKTILVTRLSRYKTTLGKPDEAKPDYKSVNMKEAVNIIKQYHRSSNGVKARTQPVTEPEHQSSTEPELQPATETETQLATELEPQPVPESEPQPVPESETKPTKKSKTKLATKLKTKLAKKTKTKPTAKPKAEPTANPEAKPAPETTEQPNQKQENHIEQDVPPEETKQLLNNILGQLKGMQRTNMFDEFSIIRLMAGVVQIIVLFCLLMTIWLLMRPARQDNSVLISLGFAMVLQMMALTFYIMQGRK
ncbi:MAG: D-glycero-beta-D-manno-heptose 1,7-bisphosphate 7-phosphatase [Phycisphaerae bacterium]|nr:D-glycero-beta-D-manno-heptose 1,7-bisphosphate 7-phosphatase [Phycisphaerae bacterium]